ncbi:O-acetyltransferase OatA [Comamonas testosteroni]|uniref:O-acetyltransferase OatA n=2 Tax=Comamonas testosteroni TaxID=285 RepID=A0A8B4S903_COMTE|nr:O-acetyltransferase OatA [Comamonas testosteroni]
MVTFLLTAVTAILLFAPPYLERFGGELIHAMASISNFYFWLESDYFDAAARLKPLLHTWSLAIEEQFYLLWPLMLVLALKVRGKWLAPVLLVTISAVSLLMNDAAVGSQSLYLKDFSNTSLGNFFASTDLPGGKAAIYFLLPFRVFEFGFGAIIVWLEMFQPKRKILLDVLMLAGLAMVGYAIFAYDEHTLFPWFNAILPCFGTALMIYSGRDSLVGRLVGNPAAVGIGKISYSVYLVHWPIIVFTEYWLIDPPSQGVRFGLCAASIVVGWLMYSFVETPLRHSKTKPVSGMVSAGDAVFALTIFASAAIFFVVGSSIWKFDGWKWRVDEKYAYSGEEYHTKFWGGIGYTSNEFIKVGVDSQKKFIFFGDSYGMQYTKAMDEFSKDNQVGFNALFDHGCLIAPGAVTLVNGTEDQSCTAEYPKIKAAMTDNPAHDVIFASSWSGYRGAILEAGETKPREDYAQFLKDKILQLKLDGGDQRRYFIIGSPNPSYSAITCLGSSTLIPRNCKERIARNDDPTNVALKALAKPGGNVYFIDPNDVLCDNDTCMAIKDGMPLYSDGWHLSVKGAEIVLPYIMSMVGKAAGT